MSTPYQVALVIPTFNERGNVEALLERLEHTLQGIAWQVTFVDDHSPDGTAELLRSLAQTRPHIRILERIGRRGLSSACVEGMLASSAPFLAVMDADLQHDDSVLPLMLQRIQNEDLDLVIGSRHVAGGSIGSFAVGRARLSNLGLRISRLVTRTEVTDPMSGFFLVRADYFYRAAPRLTAKGFKILVDLLASNPTPPRIAEVPYTFGTRVAGSSKLDLNVELEYLFLILDKLIGRWVPTRFVLFLLVGSLGVCVHLAALAVFYLTLHLSFPIAQTIATAIAMTSNFLLNNAATFRDRRLVGTRLFTGLLKFYFACSLGAIINVLFSKELLDRGIPWALAAISGGVISAIWNYGVNMVLTWRRQRQ